MKFAGKKEGPMAPESTPTSGVFNGGTPTVPRKVWLGTNGSAGGTTWGYGEW